MIPTTRRINSPMNKNEVVENTKKLKITDDETPSMLPD